jgi:hypothetical protein
MSKTRRSDLVTRAAAEAAGVATMWRAVEENAKRVAEAMAKTEDVSGSFAEIHFDHGTVRGVVKAAGVVLKIEG